MRLFFPGDIVVPLLLLKRKLNYLDFPLLSLPHLSVTLSFNSFKSTCPLVCLSLCFEFREPGNALSLLLIHIIGDALTFNALTCRVLLFGMLLLLGSVNEFRCFESHLHMCNTIFFERSKETSAASPSTLNHAFKQGSEKGLFPSQSKKAHFSLFKAGSMELMANSSLKLINGPRNAFYAYSRLLCPTPFPSPGK